MSQSPQYNQSKQSKSSASTENGYQETDNKSYLEKYWQLPYLDNLSKEAIFENDEIKEQHETMKLQSEEVMPKNT